MRKSSEDFALEYVGTFFAGIVIQIMGLTYFGDGVRTHADADANLGIGLIMLGFVSTCIVQAVLSQKMKGWFAFFGSFLINFLSLIALLKVNMLGLLLHPTWMWLMMRNRPYVMKSTLDGAPPPEYLHTRMAPHNGESS